MRHFHCPFTMLALYLCMPVKRFPAWLAGSAFAIYVLHGNVAVVGQILVKRLPIEGTFWGFAARWVFAFVVSVVVANLLKRLCPRFSAVVFGGR